MPRLLGLLMVLIFLCSPLRADSSVVYEDDYVDGVSVGVITINLADTRVKVTPVVSYGLPFCEEHFYSFICRARPIAAINGTYFNMETNTPVGEITIDGRQVNSSAIGTVLAITTDNRAFFFDAKKRKSISRKKIAMTIGAGPRLLRDGRLSRDFRHEGFKDPHIFQEAVRSGVGINAQGKLLFAVSRNAVTLERWGQTFLNLGCSDAMNLDGGGSTALFYRGVFLVNPTRKLSNILAVYYGE